MTSHSLRQSTLIFVIELTHLRNGPLRRHRVQPPENTLQSGYQDSGEIERLLSTTVWMADPYLSPAVDGGLPEVRVKLTPVNSLFDRISATTERAVHRGALVSVPTATTIIEDRGIPFVIHVTTLQDRKPRAGTRQVGGDFNPFLPPDPELLIDEVSPRHLSVLNKFNVLDHHLLIVTRNFEPQEALLTLDDFEALARIFETLEVIPGLISIDQFL